MKSIVFTMAALVIGIMLLSAGIYYLLREKSDPESRKIYGISSAVGAVLVIGTVIKMIAVGI